MKLWALALTALCLVGCVAPMTAAEDLAAKKARQDAINAKRDAYGERLNHRETVSGPSFAELMRADQEKVKAITDAGRAAADKKLADACVEGRDERIAERIKIEESRHIKDLMLDWEGEHCKSVDNSKEVTRVIQDSRGEYHTVAGRDRGVDFICDAKKPETIAKTRAHSLIVYRPSRETRERINWDKCEHMDPRPAEAGQ